MAVSAVKKVGLGFGLALAALAAVGLLSYQALQRAVEDARWVSHTHEVLAEIEDVLSVLKDVETGQRGYLITGDETYLEPYQAAIEDIDRQLRRLRELTEDNPKQQRQLDQLEPLVAAKIAHTKELVALQRREGQEAVRLRVQAGEGKKRMDAVREVVRAMTAEENALMVRRTKELDASVRTAAAVLVGGMVLALLLVGLSIASAARSAGRREDAERDLARQGELFLSVLNGVGEGVVVAEPDGRFALFNPAARRILGRGASEGPTSEWTNFYGLFLPDEVTPYPPDQLPLARALRGEAVDEVELFVRQAQRPKGIWISVGARPLASGGGVAVFRDVTARKAAEAALIDANRRLQEEIGERNRLLQQARADEQFRRQIVETANDAFVGMDAEGLITDWNRQAEQTFGWPRADALGRHLANTIIPPEYREAHTAGLRRFLATGEGPVLNRRIEVKALHRDGRLFPVELTIWPSPEGPDIRFNAFVHDISARKAAEELLRQAKEAAETANRAKSEFLANMSHELRTPLNSVIGFSNVLLKNKAGNLRDQDLTYLTRILENGKHLLGLINAVLDLSKIEAGRTELEIAPVALDRLVQDTLYELEVRVLERRVKLVADLPAPLAPLRTDAGKLKQILINLVGNALKFTESGTVAVSVIADPHDGRPQRIDVSDTGIGIPGDKQEAIFEAFRQAESGTERKYGGTGLGLTISRSLCRLLGWRLTVVSEVGKGSTFSILLTPDVQSPAQPGLPKSGVGSELPQPRPPAQDGAALLRDKRVLLIDDEADSRLLLSQLLQGLGCQVCTAADGAEGLQRARAMHPDIITLDLLMPQMSGREVLHRLRDEAELTATPVLVVSIVARDHRPQMARDLADERVGFLDKPPTPENLASALLHLLERQRPA